MLDIEFWIKSELDNINFLLPVTPSKYEVEYANQIEVVNAIVGDLNIPTSYRLSNVIIEGFFTVKDYPFTNKQTYPATNCMDYVELIKMFIAYKRVVRLIIAQGKEIKLNLPYYVESITHSEEDGSGDISYKISFKEKREMNISSGDRPVNSQSITQSKGSPIQNHIVVEGDTLKNLARQYYGDVDKWNIIFEANKDKIKIPEKIYDGQNLVIP